MDLRVLALLIVVVSGAPLVTTRAEAGAEGRVRGIVIDARTGQPLARVRVLLQPEASADGTPTSDQPSRETGGTARDRRARSDGRSGRDGRVTDGDQPVVAFTGADGRFALDAPPGPATLMISAIGYSLARQPIVVRADGTVTTTASASAGASAAAAATPAPGAATPAAAAAQAPSSAATSAAASAPSLVPVTELTIALSEGTGVYNEQVQVIGELHPRRDPGVPGEQTLGSGDLQHLKSLIADDPLRAVQALPGVAATDDLRSEFSIRGSDFRHIGVALDGVPSPLLVHTVHGVTDAGSLAMINSDILESVTLSAGSYPQRFGDRTGAFVDFRTRDGARDRVHARVSASAVNASGLVEGPIGRAARGSWLVAARQSYADWIVKKIDPNVTGTFRFTDTQGKLAYSLSPRHTLNLNFVAGTSRFDEHQPRANGNALGVGTNRSGIVSASLRSTTSATQTITQRVYGVVGRYLNHNQQGVQIGRGSSRDLSYRLDMTRLISPRLAMEAGGHLQWLTGSGELTTYDNRDRPYTRLFDASGSRQSAYGLLRWEPRPRLTIAPGARVDHWSQTGETLASPWLQAEWQLPRAFTASAGGGLYRQAPELEEVFGPRGSRDLRAARAWQSDVGIGQRLGAYRWQATFFVREERNQLHLPDDEPRILWNVLTEPSYTAPYENALDVASHGFELLLHRRAANGLSGWIGYAYADTQVHDVVYDDRYPGDADQRHTFNAYGRYRLSDRLSVSSRFRFGSNTPITGYLAQADGIYYIAAQRNQERLPAYSRLDVRADRAFAVGQRRVTLFVEVVNVYNRRNLRAVRPFTFPRELRVYNATERLFPIIPSLGVTIEF